MSVTRFILFLVLFSGLVSAAGAQTDSVQVPYRFPDTLLRYSDFPLDTDTIEYVYAEVPGMVQSTRLRDSIEAKYRSGSYNFNDPQFKNALKDLDDRHIILRPGSRDWLSYLLLALLVYFVLLRIQLARNIPVILQAYWNDRVINQFSREDNFFKMRSAALLFLLFCGIAALLLFNLSEFYHWSLSYDESDRYGFILLFLLVFYLSKYILLKVMGYLFDVQKIISGYLAIVSVANIVYALAIFPLLIFYQYLPGSWKLYMLLLILLLFVFNTFYKYIRAGVFAVSNFTFPKFYLFLYFCTLEFMPLIIIVKIFW